MDHDRSLSYDNIANGENSLACMFSPTNIQCENPKDTPTFSQVVSSVLCVVLLHIHLNYIQEHDQETVRNDDSMELSIGIRYHKAAR